MSSTKPAVDSDSSATVTTEKDRLAEYLTDAGIDTRRVLDVKAGTKEPARRWTLTMNHHEPDDVVGNYGVLAGSGLLLIDVDDHTRTIPPEFGRLFESNPTLGVVTAHDGAHLYYSVPEDAPERIDGVCDARNPSFDAVEINSADSFVVGPGSVLDDGGEYEYGNTLPIAQIDFEDFLGVLDALTEEPPEPEHTAPVGELTLEHDVSEFIDAAREHDEYLKQLMDCLGDSVFKPGQYDRVRFGDRSRNEVALTNKLMRRLGGFEDGERIARQVMDQLAAPKWSERGDAYRDSVMSSARRLSVNVGEFYRPPDSSERSGGVLREHADVITLIVRYNTGETFTTDEVASLVDGVGYQQTLKVLNDLKKAGYLTKTFVGNDEHFEKVSEIDTTTEVYDLFLSRYNTASEVREIRRKYLTENDGKTELKFE